MQNTEPGSLPPYHVESVDNAMRLLLLLMQSESLRVTDAAQELRVARSTAHRLLSTLAWRGFVSQVDGGKAYRAGPVLSEFGRSARADGEIQSLRRVARPQLETLAADCRETVSLVVLEGGDCRFVDGVEGNHHLRVGLRTGSRPPAYTVSGGTMLLSQYSAEELARMYPAGLEAATEHTLTSLADLGRRLSKVRRQGYAVSREESEKGVCGVAVPVLSNGRPIAALAIGIPSARLSAGHVKPLVLAAREAAERIKDQLQ